jgi:uncharacterized protein YdeI (YjbR/CyaY-like superfamily)
MNPKVDAFLAGATKWPAELAKLRSIILACGLTEELKWGIPCYTHRRANVVAIGEFKASAVLSFFKGSLLSDADGILERPGTRTQSVRMTRCTSVREIVAREAVLKAYIYEAIEAEELGLKAVVKRKSEPVPEEFRKKLAANRALRTAFVALTPGRQRGYLIYFSAAKQSGTRESRIKKCIPLILRGLGLRDR